MKIFSLLCFFGIIFFGTSCTSPRRITNNYLQNVNDTSGKGIINFISPTIQKADMLSIKVYSRANGLNPAIDAPYNLTENTGISGATTAIGYEVDQQGNINYPQVGTIHAEGLTREQLANFIRDKLDTSLKQPSVAVLFLNFKITVLGEVTRAGSFTVPTERITILEALGLSGDITDYGKKTSVKVLRENNGERQLGTIDLTSKDMFNSPFYHLQQNDVVFVEQTGRKLKQQDQQAIAQQIGIATSIITAIALILNIVKK